ncbi:MAG TPA: DNA mismatch repair protein MutS, partial [bacterium]|nr:DNA mismatch repair protein MutS [bacterium]
MFRLGDFYEMFFDDAVLASNILDITLTSRNKNDPKPIPLCGVPYHSVEPYIARLLENGKKVAICDQVEDPKLAKGVVKREVTRVLTPGVIPDGLGLEAKSHNFLASVSKDAERYGLAVTDVSTGLFQAGEFEGFRELFEELSRFEPREMLLAGEIAADANFSSEISRLFPAAAVSAATDCGLNLSSISLLEGGTPFVQDRRAAAKAAAAALSYISFTQKGRVSHIGSIRPISGGAAMRLDDSTKRNLELVKTMREGNRQGSLLWAIDRTL